jgi:glycosyltransferase involved in cell wall biosynthesis
MELSIVIPAYNEAATIPGVLEELTDYLKHNFDGQWELIVVDDGSTDGTAAAIKPFRDVRLIRRDENRGYGSALKTGLQEARFDLAATFDADGQHRPEDLVHIAKTLRADSADAVIGSRRDLFHSKLWRMPGKWALNWLANYLMNSEVADFNCGLRAFRRSTILKYLDLCSDRFSFSTSSTMVLLSKGYKVRWVNVQVRKSGRAGMVRVADGFNTFLLILRVAMLSDPLRIFVPFAGVLVLAGVVWAIPYLVLKQGLSVGALLLVLTGVHVFLSGLLADQLAAIRRENRK